MKDILTDIQTEECMTTVAIQEENPGEDTQEPMIMAVMHMTK